MPVHGPIRTDTFSAYSHPVFLWDCQPMTLHTWLPDRVLMVLSGECAAMLKGTLALAKTE